MITTVRLAEFARDHEDQARANGDELRAEQWNDILDKLIDRGRAEQSEFRRRVILGTP